MVPRRARIQGSQTFKSHSILGVRVIRKRKRGGFDHGPDTQLAGALPNSFAPARKVCILIDDLWGGEWMARSALQSCVDSMNRTRLQGLLPQQGTSCAKIFGPRRHGRDWSRFSRISFVLTPGINVSRSGVQELEQEEGQATRTRLLMPGGVYGKVTRWGTPM